MPQFEDVMSALKELTVAELNLSRQQLKYQESMLRLAAMPMFEEMHSILDGKQLGLLDTISKIRDEKLSFARFGDGEFLLMLKSEFNIRFQANSFGLQNALNETLLFAADNQDKILIGYPHIFHNPHWTGVFSEVWPLMKRYAVLFESIGNSHVSRPLAFEFLGNEACEAWKTLWVGSKIVVVTGRGSRFDLEPTLFGNIGSVEYVYSEPANAFDDLARVSEKLALMNPEKVLISLGPAGSILAVNLARLGIQGLDIGHLSSSYRNVMAGGRFPEKTPLKRD